ncbi:MAG: hypothetical protein IT442_06850 [Phycisphaeraceae bacterium]|nr:hypothetical protein [Phycisphaeraceae bacterium]
MSGDEAMVMLVSGLLGLMLWFFRLVRPLALGRFGRRRGVTRGVLVVWLVCLGALWGVLRFWSSWDVQSSGLYIGFYMVHGVTWLAMGVLLFRGLGVGFREDVLERSNPAALIALAGGMVGWTLCYAGGNIGDGPGWWVVVFCAVLSGSTWLILWGMYQAVTGASERITVERRLASGWRLGGFLAGSGAILGRAVAGNWVSAEATMKDFYTASVGAVVLLAAAVVLDLLLVERRWGAEAATYHPAAPPDVYGSWVGRGVLPAVALLAMAMGYILWLGKW